jgi:glycopeptide antibiotics resistance protein
VEYVGLMDLMMSARSQLTKDSAKIPDFLLYSLPTGLWSFSFIYCVTVIWSGAIRRGLVYFGIAISMIFGAEFFQLLYLEGVFDPMDLWANLVGVMAGFGAALIVRVR